MPLERVTWMLVTAGQLDGWLVTRFGGRTYRKAQSFQIVSSARRA